MDCHETYNLDPDYIYDDRTICLTEDGFGVVNQETDECDTLAIRFPHGTTVRIHNRDSITRIVETSDGSIVAAIAPDAFIVWPENEEDDWYPIGERTISSDRNGTLQSAAFIIYHPGALDLSQDEENRGCCRASIKVNGSLIYGAFQDFAGNCFPQYLRFRETTEYYDVTPAYPIDGSMATVPGGTWTTTQRYRAPQCMWNEDPYDSESLRRGIFGREETIFTPDDKFHLFFQNAVILTDSPRIEVDPGPGLPGPRELHYWIISGTPARVDDQTEETPLYWRYSITSDHPETDGSDADTGDGIDGGLAGLSTRKYEEEYSADLLAAYVEWLVKGDDEDERWKDCPHPNSQLFVTYPDSATAPSCTAETSPDEACCSDEVGAGRDNAYGDMYAWPGSPDTDYSFPGENQPDPLDQFPPPYDCIQYDVGSYLALLPNAVPEDSTSTARAAHVTPLLVPQDSIHDEGRTINLPVSLSISKQASRIEILYSIAHRWWSAPYIKRTTEYSNDGVNPIVETEISAEEDLEGEPATVAPCKRLDDPALPQSLAVILTDKCASLPVGGSWSRVITFECPSS